MNFANHHKTDSQHFFCLLIVFYNFLIFFFTHVKTSKDSSAKYQKNKERLQKKSCGRYHSLSKEEKDKKQQIWKVNIRMF